MKKIMEQVINEVTDLKAESDLMLSTSKSLKMSSQNGSISEYKVSSSQLLGIRLIKDGRVGTSYTESFDEESLRFMVKQALVNAEISSPNPHENILDLSGSISDKVSMSEPEIDINTKTQKTIELEMGVKHLDPRVTAVPYNSYVESEYESFYLSSRGRSADYLDKSYSIATSALLDEKGKKANYDDFHMSYTFKDLQWNKIIETSLFHARNILEEQNLPSGKYPVKFSEDALKNLIGCFSNLYSAKSAIDKMNPWGSKVGEEVISKDITIQDHPLYVNSFRISKFDSEGVERKPLTLIEDGVLKSLYHNSATAKALGTKTTAHAVRSPGGPLGVGGTDLIITGKNNKPLPQRYLEVIQMDGLYSGANRVTGNFSVAVKGYVWENGERVMTFGNITLSGNLMEMLKNAEVVGVGLEASTDHSFFSVPLIFPGLSIAGA
jgi:PmbA protein